MLATAAMWNPELAQEIKAHEMKEARIERDDCFGVVEIGGVRFQPDDPDHVQVGDHVAGVLRQSPVSVLSAQWREVIEGLRD